VCWRLALLHAASAALLVAGFGGYGVHWLESRLVERVDDELSAGLDQIEILVRVDGSGRLALLAGTTDEEQDDPAVLFALVAPDGTVALSGGTADAALLGGAPRPDEGLGFTLPVTVSSGRHRLRAASSVIKLGQRRYLLRVARDLTPVAVTVAELRRILLAALPVVTLVALWGGYALARRALAPVDAMTAEARRLAADLAGHRLPVANPGDELGRLALTLNAALDRIESGVESARRFTADAAHELRTPVAAVRAIGEVTLVRARGASAYRDAIGDMLVELGRLAELVDRLLFLARADADQLVAERAPFAPAALVGRLVEIYGPLAEERGIALVAAECDPGLLVGDARLLESAVGNLVDNALRAAVGGGSVVLAARRTQGGWEISVSDDGKGLPPDQLERVFERFVRLDPSRRGGGAGLGLSIALRIAEAHGGTIRCFSRPGVETRFTVEIPGRAAAAQEVA
jgi:heavy metal sensor kinase